MLRGKAIFYSVYSVLSRTDFFVMIGLRQLNRQKKPYGAYVNGSNIKCKPAKQKISVRMRSKDNRF